VKVKVIPQAATMNLFLRDGVEVASAMWTTNIASSSIAG
jgi:hypothetical protein